MGLSFEIWIRIHSFALFLLVIGTFSCGLYCVCNDFVCNEDWVSSTGHTAQIEHQLIITLSVDYFHD